MGIVVDAAGVRADAALHDLRAFDALEREARAADVVEDLDRVAVQNADLVAHLQQRDDGIGVSFARSVLQRVDGERVVELGHDEELAVGREEVPVDPDEVDDRSEVGIDVLHERRAVRVVEVPAARDRKLVERVVERHRLPVVADVADRRHRAERVDAHEERTHHAVERAVPVDAAARDAGAGSRRDESVAGAKVRLRDARRCRRRHHVDGVRRAEVRRRRRVDACEEGDCGHVISTSRSRSTTRRSSYPSRCSSRAAP